MINKLKTNLPFTVFVLDTKLMLLKFSKRGLLQLTLAVCLLILLLRAFNSFWAAEAQFADFSGLELIGHRGGGALAPENTLAAIDSGIAYSADILEIDIHQTADNQLVVMHDKTVDRTTSGKGTIATLNYAEIRKMNIKSKVPDKYISLKVPTLDEVFKHISGKKVKLLIELKNPELYPGILQRLADKIRQFDMQNRVLVFSFDRKSVLAFKRLMPQVRVGLFCLGHEQVAGIRGIDYIAPNIWTLVFRHEMVSDAHARGIKVFVWTVNKKYLMRFGARSGVDGIITDRPDLFDLISKGK